MSQNNNPDSPNNAPDQIKEASTAEKETKEMSEPTINIGDYLAGCEYEEKLEQQLKSNLDKADSKLNRCTYEKEGYKYQQVFSCRTCYEDQVKEILTAPDCQFKDEADEFNKLENEEAQLEYLSKVPNQDFEKKYKLKPHGFCLGCMLVCHENHDVNELYCKLGFRCDCGNSHLPSACQLNNDKDYANSLNTYG